MANLHAIREQDGYQFIPTRLQRRFTFNIDDLDPPAVMPRNRFQCFDQFMTQMAPLSAQDREDSRRRVW
jgi:hypothetical protein